MSAYLPTTHRVKNLHNGNYIGRRTAEEYIRMASKDRANGWAKALDAEANESCHNKHVAAMRYYLANCPTLGETHVHVPHDKSRIPLRRACLDQVVVAPKAGAGVSSV